MTEQAEQTIATAHSIIDNKPHYLGLFDGDQDAADELTEALTRMGFHADWLETSPLQLTVTRKERHIITNQTPNITPGQRVLTRASTLLGRDINLPIDVSNAIVQAIEEALANNAKPATPPATLENPAVGMPFTIRYERDKRAFPATITDVSERYVHWRWDDGSGETFMLRDSWSRRVQSGMIEVLP